MPQEGHLYVQTPAVRQRCLVLGEMHCEESPFVGKVPRLIAFLLVSIAFTKYGHFLSRMGHNVTHL
jgi:hypothetical protein